MFISDNLMHSVNIESAPKTDFMTFKKCLFFSRHHSYFDFDFFLLKTGITNTIVLFKKIMLFLQRYTIN